MVFEKRCACGSVYRRRADYARHASHCKRQRETGNVANTQLFSAAGTPQPDSHRLRISAIATEDYQIDMHSLLPSSGREGNGETNGEPSGYCADIQSDDDAINHFDDEVTITDLDTWTMAIAGESDEVGVGETSFCGQLKDGCGKKKVSKLQCKAAIYILHSGAHKQGPSHKNTAEYLSSLDSEGEAGEKWPSAFVFWSDYERRRKRAMKSSGVWKKVPLTVIRSDLPQYTVLIRDITHVVKYILEHAGSIIDLKHSEWEHHLRLSPRISRDGSGRRSTCSS